MASGVSELLQKALWPTSLNSAQLAELDSDILESLVLSATTDHLRIVQGIRDNAKKVLEGEKSPEEARRLFREVLDYAHYVSPEGKEGTIQDLRSPARQRMIIDTTASRAANLAYKKNLQSDGRLHAWQFTRTGARRVPRDDWDDRWAEAYAQLSPEQRQEVNLKTKTALIDSPIWSLISRFKTGYPPFDFNSGMGVREVPATGLVPTGSSDRPVFNADMEIDGAPVDPDLRQWVKDNLDITVTLS